MSPPSSRRETVRETVAAGLLIAVYVVLATRNLLSPGFTSEFTEAARAVDFTNALQAAPPADWFRLLRAAPTVYAYYHGLMVCYLMVPFFLVFGTGWIAIKSWPVAAGAVTLAVTYGFAREWFGRRTAAATLLLLAIHPTFLIGTKLGVETKSAMQIFTMGTLFCLAVWWKGGRAGWLASAALLAGLGAWGHLWFLWFVAGGFLTAFVFRRAVSARLGTGRRAVAAASAAGGAFLLGFSPYLRHLWREGAGVIHLMAAPLGSRVHSTGLANYFPNLADQGVEFCRLLSGRAHFEEVFYAIPGGGNLLYPVVFLAAAGVGLAVGRRRRFAAVLLLLAGMWLCSPYSPSGRPPGWLHMFVFYPLPPMLLAAAAVAGWDAWRSRRARTAWLAAGILFLAAEGAWLGHVLTTFDRVGAVRRHADAIDRVADWLATGRETGHALVFLRPNDLEQLRVRAPGVSAGWRLPTTRDLLGFERFFAAMPLERTRVLSGPNRDVRNAFLRWAAWKGLRARVLRRFLDGRGRPAYEIYALDPPAAGARGNRR